MKESNVLEIPKEKRVGLKVRNLSVSIKSQRKQDLEDDGRHKILNDISFYLPQGQLMAIMGGSGSGKTTLLNTLSQRTNVKNKKLEFEGKIEFETNLQHVRHSYLLQTDLFLPGLTLLETLSTQADLRLPNVSKEEKLELIYYILEVLELLHLKDKQVTSFTHQTTLSGGEQRRVSLAIQLLAKPSILFLDEPTTGLDASTSLKLVHVLKKLTSPQYGITIIVSIHQPRPEVVELFDKICLLTRGGRLVYYGSLTKAYEHFNDIDFLERKPKNQNIIDYIMDLSVKDTTSIENEQITIMRINKLVEEWKTRNPTDEIKIDKKNCYKQFNQNLKLFARSKDDKISFLTELKILTKRVFILSYRDYKSLSVLLLMSIFVACSIGWMFYRPKHDLAGIRSLISLLYVIMEVVGFVPMYFETERLWETDGVFFYREYCENISSITGFILSRRIGKFLIEDIPITVIYSLITYFMWGLTDSNFGPYFVIILLLELCLMSSSLLLFTMSPSFAISSLLVNLFYHLQNCACGYFVNARTMPAYVRWVKYLAYFWYAFGALLANQFTNWYGDCPYDRSDTRCNEFEGNYQIKLLGFPPNWVGPPIGYLIAWVIGFNIMSGVAIYLKNFDIGMAQTKRNKFSKHDEKEIVLSNKYEEVKDTEDINISVENIHLSANTKTLVKKGEDKVLLDNVSATFLSNSVNVIMGPSGSGKTTLLNYLSNRLSKLSKYSHSGAIKINNVQQVTNKQLSKISAYVTQYDNSLIDNLTVRETLYYQAKLRLPLDEHYNIPHIINNLIRQTGLVDCADTLIGSEFVKGISGGEKRRVSIAIQLLSKPKILFLDEPTSGLDSSTAATILELLSDLSREDSTTIILTIHQPNEEMFKRFGNLLLLSRGGKVIYDGDSNGIINYLDKLGYQNNSENIADYILDLLSQKLDEVELESQSRITSLIDNWKEFEKLPLSTSDEYINLPKYYYKQLPSYVTFPTIFKRQLLTAYRSKYTVISRCGQTIFLSIIHTLFFAPLPNSQDGISNRLGLVQDVLNLYYVGLVNNLTLYPFEKDLFYQEYKDGIYGVFEFSLSYLINELPTEIIPCFFFSALIVFVCGLPRNATMYFSMFASAFACLNCGESLGIFINSCFNHLGVATNILSTLIILAIFQAGTMSLHMPHFFKAINYINPMKYAVAICANLGFENQVFSCDEGAENCLLGTGQDVLEYYGMKANVSLMIGGLFICLVAYRVVAIISLYIRVKWPSNNEGINSIQITGDFDSWSQSLPKITSPPFNQKISIDSKKDIIFKFIINDGNWSTNDSFAVVTDENGNANNIIYANELVEEKDEKENDRVDSKNEAIHDHEEEEEGASVLLPTSDGASKREGVKHINSTGEPMGLSDSAKAEYEDTDLLLPSSSGVGTIETHKETPKETELKKGVAEESELENHVIKDEEVLSKPAPEAIATDKGEEASKNTTGANEEVTKEQNATKNVEEVLKSKPEEVSKPKGAGEEIHKPQNVSKDHEEEVPPPKSIPKDEVEIQKESIKEEFYDDAKQSKETKHENGASSSSSFAAVHSPPVSSDYEKIESKSTTTEEPIQIEFQKSKEVPNKADKIQKPTLLQQPSESTIEENSNSGTITPKTNNKSSSSNNVPTTTLKKETSQPSRQQQPKIPGQFPLDSNITSKSASSNKKNEGGIFSKFKSLFK
ncbi:unnamed protein product [Candida verbasci]|uniref:ABC transporter domain-containing protein n=1 Tax=Candida verbasci TaxID=1227364 RepID=A0A9W4TYM1_9ASCO|nr:unnamed protein product [Candida verbasci]